MLPFPDFMRPDRGIVGVENDVVRNFMRLLYRPLLLIETPILFTNLETQELIKYASNAFSCKNFIHQSWT